MWDVLKLFFDTFENYITVPIIIFIICLIFKAPVKKAFMSAVPVSYTHLTLPTNREV